MVLQLLAATEKTGQLEVRGENEEQRGFLGVSKGRLVSAQYEDEDGYLALGAVFAIDRGDFEFLPQDRVELGDLSGGLEELLDRANVERERVRGIREVIANDRVRFRLSERATEQGEITLAPAQWKALLLIDGERDVASLAERLAMRRLSARQLLADLVRAGLVDPRPAEGVSEGGRSSRRRPPKRPIPPTLAGEQVVIRGKLPDFPLQTIVQLLAETKKTGRVEVRAGRDSSTLGMSAGRLVSATCGEEDGELGLGAAFTAQEGEFDFVSMAEAPAANLSGQLDPLLDRAAGIRDRIVAIRGSIPNERARFTLSERATRNPEIVLTPEQWRVLLGVNGERDAVGIADHLRMRRLPVMMVLADLVRGGYVDVIPATELTWPYVERRKSASPAPAAEPTTVEEEVAPPRAEAAAPGPEVVAPAPIWPEVIHEPQVEAPAVEQPAPPPPAWEPQPAETPEAAAAAATAEAFASAPLPAEPEVDPRLAVFGAPTAEPEVPAWEAPAAEPAVPAWEAPAPEGPDSGTFQLPMHVVGTPAPEAPAAEAAPVPAADVVTPPVEWPERGRGGEVAAPTAPLAPVPALENKIKAFFGGLFGGGAKAATVTAAPPVRRAATRAGQLASFANELVAAYNSGQYGKARVEDRMLSLIMRADEQADPIDRPLPVANDRLDVGSIDRDAIPERQALPYLAVLVRQIYDEAERALGKDKARRAFRDVRDRLFGADLTLLRAPEVSGRMPKV